MNLFYGDRLTYDTNRKIPMLDGREINAMIFNDLLKEAAETRRGKDDEGKWKTLGFTKISRMKKAVIEVAKMHEVDTTDRIRDEIIKEYGDRLEFNTTNNKIYVIDGETGKSLPSKSTVEKIVNEVKSKYGIKKGEAKTLVEEVARKKSFKDTVDVNAIGGRDEGIDETNWEDYLDREINDNGEGKLKHSIRNYRIFLQYSPKYHNRLSNNLFTKTQFLIRGNGEKAIIDEDVIAEMKDDIEDYFGDYKNLKADEAIRLALKDSAFHPVKEYHNKCRAIDCGDGLEEAETLFIKFLRADDTPLNRKIPITMLLGAVCRIEEETPSKGFDFDYMCILDGPQGIGKSKLTERLFGAEYTVTNIDISNEQDYVGKLNNARVGVFEELSTFDNRTNENIKDFITKTSNYVRMPYARRPQLFPRHTVFFGNTNKRYYLRDYDTNYERRYLIVECHGDGHSSEWWEKNLTQETIDKIWAQVLRLYDSGDYKKYLQFTKEEIEELKKIQLRKKTFNENAVLIEDVKNLLEGKYPAAFCENEEQWSSVFDKWRGIEGITKANEIPCVWMSRKLGKSISYLRIIVEARFDFEWQEHGSYCYEDKEVFKRKTPIPITEPEEVVFNEAKRTLPYQINFRDKTGNVSNI